MNLRQKPRDPEIRQKPEIKSIVQNSHEGFASEKRRPPSWLFYFWPVWFF
jgi:hypothetical protein